MQLRVQLARLGIVLYWVAWTLALLVFPAAIILVASGHWLVALLLGGVGLCIWLFGFGNNLMQLYK
jgi:hypothetical protein